MTSCSRCGGELVEGAAYCHACGEPAGASSHGPDGAQPPETAGSSQGEPSMPTPNPPFPPASAPYPPHGVQPGAPPGVYPPTPFGVPFRHEGAALPPPPGASSLPSSGAAFPSPFGDTAYKRPSGGRTNGWAVASLVLGVLSFMCLPLLGGILAIVFALVARSRMREPQGELKGGGAATAGLVLGVVNLAVLLLLAALAVPVSIHFLGKTRTVTRTVSPQGAQSVVAELKARSGEVEVEGGAEGLFEGTFTFNVEDWEPSVEYSVRGEEGRLSVTQGGDWWAPDFWLSRNRWLVRLAEKVPLELWADLSSAEGVFRLGGTALRSLEVESGSGDIEAELSGKMAELGRIEITQGSGGVSLDMRGDYASYVQMEVENASGRTEIDLRGHWEGGLGGQVKCGSGDVTLYLPEEYGVRVRVHKGSGRLHAEGMILESSDPEGALYVNGAFRESPVTLQIDLECSSGDIVLKAGD